MHSSNTLEIAFDKKSRASYHRSLKYASKLKKLKKVNGPK